MQRGTPMDLALGLLIQRVTSKTKLENFPTYGSPSRDIPASRVGLVAYTSRPHENLLRTHNRYGSKSHVVLRLARCATSSQPFPCLSWRGPRPPVPRHSDYSSDHVPDTILHHTGNVPMTSRSPRASRMTYARTHA